MPQRPIGVTDVASGAGVADFRTRERTVGGATVVEQYLLPISERVVSARCTATTFRTLGTTTANTNIASLFNKTGSGVLVAVRALVLEHDYTAVVTTVRNIAVTEISVAPTTGTLLTPVVFDTTQTRSTNVEWRGATASDGGAATALTATPESRFGQAFTFRANGASQIEQINTDARRMIPFADDDPVIFRPGEGLLLTAVEALAATYHLMVNIAWEEYTLP